MRQTERILLTTIVMSEQSTVFVATSQDRLKQYICEISSFLLNYPAKLSFFPSGYFGILSGRSSETNILRER